MPSPSASTFFRFVRDPKHDGGWEKPQIARIEADLGVGYRRQDCQGGDHQGHEGGHGGTRSTTGDTITKDTTDTKGARAWPAQDWMDGEGKPQIARIGADWGSATADRTARGGDHKAHEGWHKGTRRGTGKRPASLPRNLASLRSNPPKPPNLQTSKLPNFQTSKLPAPPCVFAVPSRIARTRDGARRFSSGGWPSEDRRLIHPGAAADPPWIGRRSKVINNPTLPAAPAESVSTSARGAHRGPSRFPLIGWARRRFSPKTPGTFGTLRTRGFFVIVFCKCRSERQRFGIAGGGPWSLAHPW